MHGSILAKLNGKMSTFYLKKVFMLLLYHLPKLKIRKYIVPLYIYVCILDQWENGEGSRSKWRATRVNEKN